MVTHLHAVRRPDILEIVRELCEPTTHREPYETRRGATRIIQHHTTTSPSLIDQLAAAITPSTSIGAGTIRPAGSRPAARIDAIDTLTRIDHNAARWLELYELPTTGDTTDRIRRLTPAAVIDRQLEHDIGRWWTWARITTGWDQPAWAPDNTCPLCATRGTLRIRLADKLATCLHDNCRETWNPTTIGLLANHIRAENGEQDQAS